MNSLKLAGAAFVVVLTTIGGMAQSKSLKTEVFASAASAASDGWGELGSRINGQNYGLSDTQNASGAVGEAGGTMTRKAIRSSYCDVFGGPLTLADRIAAQGSFTLSSAPASGNASVVYGHGDSTQVGLNSEANQMGLVLATGPARLFAHLTFSTGSASRYELALLTNVVLDQLYDWDYTYDPAANGGNGALTVDVVNGGVTNTSVLNLSAAQRALGAAFDSFGIIQRGLSDQSPAPSVSAFIDDVVYTAVLAPPPKLTVSRSGGDLVLSWVAGAGTYSVQFRPDLPNPPAWAFITNAVTSAGGTNTVRMSPPGIRGFCRLAQQASSPLDLLMQCDVGGCGPLQTNWVSLPICATYPNVNGSGVDVNLATGVAVACDCRDRTGAGALANVERDFLFANDQISTPGGDFIVTFSKLMPGIYYRLRSYHSRTDQSSSHIQGVVVTGATGVFAPAQIYQDHSIMDRPAEILFTAASNQVSIRYIAPTQAEAGSGAQAFLNGLVLERAPVMVWSPVVQFETSASSGLETAGPAALNVVLSEALAQTTTVNYVVTGGTAAGGGVDYTLPAGTLTFAPGVTIRSIPLSIVNDGVGENDETIEVTLSNPMGGTALGFRNKHTYTIVDPRPKVSFAVDASSGLESVTPAKITVSLSAASTNTVTVNYAVSGGTATGGGVDYTLPNGTLSFSPGQVTTNISLAVVNDLLSESNETVVITLAAPGNATLGVTTQHTYTIVDDDSGLRWDNLTWFYNVAPTLLFINASNQLEWDPHQDGQFSTRLPDQRLSVVGDKVQIVYYWLTDGDYGVCPDCFACLKPGQNNATCSDNDIHCIAGTSDMRIGLFQSDGEYITADGYNVASNSIFAGYKGYSFRFGPNMMHDPGTNASPAGSGRWVDCRPEVHKTGAFHKKPASLANLMYSNDNQEDYIYGFNLPPGQFSLLTVSLERLSSSSVRLSITLNGLTQTWTDTSSSEQPTNINVLAFHMRNGRPYSRLVLAKP